MTMSIHVLVPLPWVGVLHSLDTEAVLGLLTMPFIAIRYKQRNDHSSMFESDLSQC